MNDSSQSANANSAQPLTVSDSTFQKDVLDFELPVLVDFYADWCPPCKAIAPILAEIATEYSGKLRVAKLDVEQSVDKAGEYNIRSIPTLMLFVKGEKVKQIVGAPPDLKNQLIQWFTQYNISK